MAFDITATINAIASVLETRGEFSSVQIGEPKSPPDGEMSAAVYATSASVVGASLETTIEVHQVTVRIYRNMMSEPEEDNEIRTSQAVTGVTSDLLSDYDLGGTVRNISIGEYGSTITADWGYMDVGGVMYRSVDITVPFIVDGSATPVQ